MSKLIAAKEAFLDQEKNLWGTYVGFENNGKTLYCTVWGNTERQSIDRAEGHAKLLNTIKGIGGTLWFPEIN